MRHILSKYNLEGKAPFLKRSTTKQPQREEQGGRDALADVRLRGSDAAATMCRWTGSDWQPLQPSDLPLIENNPLGRKSAAAEGTTTLDFDFSKPPLPRLSSVVPPVPSPQAPPPAPRKVDESRPAADITAAFSSNNLHPFGEMASSALPLEAKAAGVGVVAGAAGERVGDEITLRRAAVHAVARLRRADGVDVTAVANLTGHTGTAYSVAFNHDGSVLASGSTGDTIKLWRMSDNTEIKTLTGHTSWVHSVAFNHDGSILASGSTDKTIKLWRMSDNTLITTLTGHGNGVYSVAFNPDGSILASGSSDDTIKLWRMSDNRLIKTLTGHKPDGYSGVYGVVQTVAFNHDGSILASGSYGNCNTGDYTIKLWRMSDNALIKTLRGHKSLVNSVAFNHDGSILASGSGKYNSKSGDYNDRLYTIKLWRMSDSTLIKTLTGHTRSVNSVAFNHDGSILASGSEDATIKLWRMSDTTEIKTLRGHTKRVQSVTFNFDGSILASGSGIPYIGSGDNTIKLWRQTCSEDCSNHSSCSSIAIYGSSYTCTCDHPWSGPNCELCNGRRSHPHPRSCPRLQRGYICAMPRECQAIPDLLALCPIACDSCTATTTATTTTATTTSATTTTGTTSTTTGLCNGTPDPKECGQDTPYTVASCQLSNAVGVQVRKRCLNMCGTFITTSSTITTTTTTTVTYTSTTATTTTVTTTTSTTTTATTTTTTTQTTTTTITTTTTSTVTTSTATTTTTISTTTVTTTTTTVSTTTTSATTTTTTIMCNAGQYFQSTGTAQECIPCPENSYQTLSSHRETVCIAQPLCKPGEYISPANTTQQLYKEARACAQCPDWYYQPTNVSHRISKCEKASVDTCSNAGNFNPGTGKCDCFKGYGGDDCSDVAAGCMLLDAALESRLAAEATDNIQKVIPSVASISAVSVLVAYGYLLKGGGAPNGATSFSDLSFQTHLWAFLSVGLKLFDMQTDWSFFFISLRGEPFESQYMLDANATRRFTQTGRYNKDVAAIQMASFFSCSCGTLLTFFDIYGTRQRLGGAVAVASLATLLVMLIEDVPQLAINIIYIKTMATASSAPAAGDATESQDYLENIDAISIISLVASILNLLYSIYLLVSDRCKAAKDPANTFAQVKARLQQEPKEEGGAESEAENGQQGQYTPSDSSFTNPVFSKTAQPKSADQGSASGMDFNGFSASDVGKPCEVIGVGSGVIRFVGVHADKNKPQIGVEMDEPNGKDNGTVNGHKYFECKDGFGLLTIPSIIKISGHGNDDYVDIQGALRNAGKKRGGLQRQDSLC